MIPTTAKSALHAAALCAALFSSACTYSLKGRVVEGPDSYVAVVDSSDPRLTQGKGLVGASLNMQLDPMKINRKSVARNISGANGEFELPVDEVGAGLLEYDVGVYVRRKGCEPAEGFFRLPGSGKRLLVVMSPGKDHPTSDEGDDTSATIRQYMK